MAERPTPTTEFSELEPISISRLATWASCQAKGYLRYRLKEKPPTEGHYLITGGILHQAVEDYYNGLNDSPGAAVQALFLTEMEKRGVARPHAVQAILAAKNEVELVEEFRNGKYKKPDGSIYTAPRMTKVWKEEAAKRGLVVAQRELANVIPTGVKLPDGGLIEMAGRIMDLAARYEQSLLIRREKLEIIKPEVGFDFVVDGVRFLGYMDLVAKVKPEHRDEFKGKSWVLVDYKTGKAKELEVHAQDSHKSMQLSLYHHAITEELNLCGPDDLYMALHYVDAQFPAVTHRQREDFDRLLELAKYYQLNSDSPGMVKRLFYDSRDCEDCELRQACIRRFGMPTCASSVPESTEDDLDWSF